MGATLSTKSDFNRVLARQPRASIKMPNFEASPSAEGQVARHSLFIPLPQLVAETNHPQAAEPVVASDARSSKSEIPARSNSPLAVKDPKPQPPQDDSSTQLQQVPSDRSISQRPTKDDYVVFARSLLDAKDQQQAGNYCSALFQRQRTVVERNGKQFVVELQTRIERRYVQYTDAATDRKRIFEVIDYIPYRVVRPCQQQSSCSLPKTGHCAQTSSPPTFVQDNKPNNCLQSLPYENNKYSLDGHNISRDIYNESPASSSTSSDSDYFSKTDSSGSADEDDKRIYHPDIHQARQSYVHRHAYERKDPSFVTYRKDTGATHEIIGRYQLPTPSDSFVFPKSLVNEYPVLQWSDISNIAKAPKSNDERSNQSSHLSDTSSVVSSGQ